MVRRSGRGGEWAAGTSGPLVRFHIMKYDSGVWAGHMKLSLFNPHPLSCFRMDAMVRPVSSGLVLVLFGVLSSTLSTRLVWTLYLTMLGREQA